MANRDNLVPLIRAEHISPDDTGDNISGKRVANYKWDGANWQRDLTPLINAKWDYLVTSNDDGQGNPQTFIFKTGGSGGTTVATLTATWNSSSNIRTLSLS